MSDEAKPWREVKIRCVQCNKKHSIQNTQLVTDQLNQVMFVFSYKACNTFQVYDNGELQKPTEEDLETCWKGWSNGAQQIAKSTAATIAIGRM